MDIEKLKPQVLALGKIYRVLYDENVTAASINIATMRPMRGYTERMIKMQRKGKITAKMEKQLTVLTDIIQVDDWIDIMDTVLPLELQSIWQIGFYAGPDENRLKTLRKSKNMTQNELAIAIGVTQKDVSRWESGNVRPTTTSLVKLAKVFGCKVDDLIEE